MTKHQNVLRSIYNVSDGHNKSSISKIAETCEKEQLDILSIKPFHLDEIKRLPQIHGDPFDRLIISQAITENLVIITKDGIIPKYNVKVLW